MHFLAILLIFLQFSAFSAGNSSESGYELILVQALWRHGDRAPQYPYRNDRILEEDWKRIGSGIGLLTVEGLKQQYELGKAIKNRYIDSGFLPEEFDENLIQFRSTNRNRTITSAEANFVGMYQKTFSAEKVKFPIFVPENYDADCVNNVFCMCERRDLLQKMGRKLEEVRELEEDTEVQLLFQSLSFLTGEKIDIENFWRIPDTLRGEKRHFPTLLANLTPWYSDDLLEKMEILLKKINKFTSGIYEQPLVFNKKQKKFVDISKEISKLLSGPLVEEIYERMDEKLRCSGAKYGYKCSRNVRELKYFAYSSHDMTLFSLLTALGLQNVTSSEVGGWPHYATSMFIELFVRTSDKRPFFKVIYRTPDEPEFVNLTPRIPGCDGKSICPMEVFQEIYEDLRLDMPVDKYCHVTDDLEV